MRPEYNIYQWKPVQVRLTELGFYSGRVDGDRGPLTDQAIAAYKSSIGFVKTSFYGPLTHEALMKSPPMHSAYPWFSEASRVLGLHERRSTSELNNWFTSAVAWIDPREVAWCGAFVATCYRKWNTDVVLPTNPLGARQWGAFGEACVPQRGAVMTFWRGSPKGWQGHVGFYQAEDDHAYHVLGGNQADSVSITRVARDRLLQSRWPIGVPQPKHIRKVTADGKLSTNEA